MSSSMKSCCPPGSHPELKEDTSRKLDGVVSEVDGLPIYLVKGDAVAAKKNNVEGSAIVVFYDVYGFSGGRVKSYCDGLAKSGVTVVMPDVYKSGGGGGVQDYGGFGDERGQKFIAQFTFENLKPKMKKVVDFLKKEHGVDRVATMGFCWGAWATFKFASIASEYSMKCGVSCHPSIQISKMFFGEEVDDVARAVKIPQLLMPAGGDPDFVKEGGSVQTILKGNNLDCQVHAFPEMQHGWTIRGDCADKTIARDVEKSLDLAKSFFIKNLSAGSSL